MSFPRDTVASFGAMSLSSSGGGRRGGGDKRGGGKKPSGSGRIDVPLASPKKTRSPLSSHSVSESTRERRSCQPIRQ
jgi:hypothetical protein